MHRFESIAFAISVVLLTCICSAQQPGRKAVLDLNRDNRTLSYSALLPTADSTPAIREARRPYGLHANGSPSLYMPSSPDNWNGGTGNWSNGSDWSAGAPGASSDVTIYSGGYDTVTLDTSPTINSLTLGGAGRQFSSELTDGGIAQTLTISKGLTIGQSGLLTLYSGSTVSAGADLSNAGTIQIVNGSALSVAGNLANSGTVELGSSGNVGTLNNSGRVTIGPGATLNLTNQLGGITDIAEGSEIDVFGNFNDVLGGTSALASLSSVEGVVALANGQTTDIFPASSARLYIEAGALDASRGSTIQIFGDVEVDGGFLTTGGYYGGFNNTIHVEADLLVNIAGGVFLDENGDKVEVDGDLFNEGGRIGLEGSNQTLTVGTLTNNGSIEFDYYYYCCGNDTIHVETDLVNIAGNVFLYGPGDKVEVDGDLFNEGGQIGLEGPNETLSVGTLTNNGSITLNGPNATATIGSVTNGGTIDLENASTLTVNGDVNNSGTLYTSFYGTGGNTVTVGGLLTNEATGQINLNGPGDVLQALGGLSNSGVININNGSTIDPPFVTNGGTINIGSMSKLVVGMGGYTQLANGTLGEIITGHNSFGVINVNGSALLDGTLDILLQGGFNPRVGSIFQFIFANPGQISGTFANIENDFFNDGTEQWDVIYDNADGIVELTAEKARPIPEPSTLLVLIPGLLGMGYGLRRKLLV